MNILSVDFFSQVCLVRKVKTGCLRVEKNYALLLHALEMKLHFIDYGIILLSWLVATHCPPKLTLTPPYPPPPLSGKCNPANTLMQ